MLTVCDTLQVLISGSIAVQAALGITDTWKTSGQSPSDVDIFVTWGAASRVRERLIQTCGLICGGTHCTLMCAAYCDNIMQL